MRALIVAALIVVAGCGGEGPPHFQYETRAVWAQAPERQSAVDRNIAWALQYWGGDPAAVQGWTFTFTDGRVQCGDLHVRGCSDFGTGQVGVDAEGSLCPEESPLAHEIGHLVIGDPDHRDPRWQARELDAHFRDVAECSMGRW